MSTRALRTSSELGPAAPTHGRSAGLLRHADLAVLVVALPIFLAARLPLIGYAACAGAWVVQRALRAGLDRRAERSDSPRTAVGLLGISMFARVWFVALAILAAGLVDRDAGLPAAVLGLTIFQAYITTEMITRSRQARTRA